MIAVDFPQRNLELAKDQPEYQMLPVYCEVKEVILPNGPFDEQGAVITRQVPWTMTACFELSDEEIAEIVATKKLWYKQCLYGHNFQPVMMSTQNPFVPE